ncbi:MAG: hypothetical protein IJA69_00970, partial [Clostridia bacterium]|nr:hypothetical protein [Clostridia bacterium]
AHAPYYAETFIKIKCPQAKDGTFSIPIVTHHGDGGNPEAFSDIDKDSLINSMGHTHNMQVWLKTRLTYDGITNTNVKKEELNIILPANGGGLYGNAKGYKKAHKSPYLALDLTTAKNPRFDYYKNNDHIEMPIVLATRSFNILSRANTAQKDAIVNNAKKQIERNKKITQIKMLAQLKDLIELLEQYGLETTEDVKHAIEKQIIKCGQTKNKTQNLAPINSDEFTLE